MLIQITSENDDTVQTPIGFAAGDEIQLNKDAAIVAQDVTIVGADDASGATMTLLGSVQAGVAVVYAKSGGHTITIGPDGDMSGTIDGILLDAGTNVLGGNIIQNNGLISASNDVGVGIDAGSSNNQIINTGFIGGLIGISLGTTDPATHSIAITPNNKVVNSGTIFAAATAVALWGDGSSLKNTGTLSGGLSTVQLYGTSSGKISVENTGIIQSSNGRAIVGSEEMDWIYNAGTITGSVFLNDGNDLYDGRNGTISGVELGAGDDTAYGGVGFEWLDGGDGNDALEGGLGDDTLVGGAGIDTALFVGVEGATVNLANKSGQLTKYGTDTLTEIENLIGGAGADHFIGDDNTANALAGGEGDDTLDGGLGNDTLNGGSGIDTALFSGAVGATVNLATTAAQVTGYGTDVLIGIENLIGGTGSDHFIGDTNANVFIGGDGDDTLNGGLGSDTAIFRGAVGANVDLTKTDAQVTNYGADTLLGIENLVGGTGADNFIGDGNANMLEGGEGNDTLNGGAGIDTAVFSGTVGAIVDLTKTDAQETNYGADILFGIENLIGGSGADHFIGDGQDNLFVGGDGNDVLDGGGGIDTAAFSGLTGVTVNLATGQASGHGVDVLISIENVTGGSGSDNLTGSSGANWLQGGSGSDLVNGGLGHDTLDGGSGLDVLRFTGSAGATVNLALKAAQNTGYGRDLILGFEALWGGAGADRFTGNSANNAFIGESGRDTISGGSGHDTLAGGLGNDRLTGGSGKDLFVFDTKLSSSSNLDTITDFKRVDDTFRLENAIFKKLAKVGTLSKSFFAVAAKAKDKNDYIVYDKAKGALSYDADGSGKGAAVKFAQITKGTVLGYNDFLII